MRSTWMIAALLPLMAMGCKSEPAECGPAECEALVAKAVAEANKAPKGVTLSAFEAELLAETLREVREGVRPYSDKAVGVCKGSGKECPEFLGTDAGELPPGEYMVRAELAVPNVGPRGTWKITFATECKTSYTNDKGDTRTSESNRSRDYEVSYAGSSRGYRLSPMLKIKSPSETGRQECSYTITAPHGDGDKKYTGSWVVPQG